MIKRSKNSPAPAPLSRRKFLISSAAAGTMMATPFPIKAVSGASAAGYSRYVYGLGVFQARTKASITSAELMKSLAISQTQAKAMMGEMLSSGVVRQGALPHMAHAVSQHMKPRRALDAKELHDQLMALTDDAPDDEVEAFDADQQMDDNFEQNSDEPLA